MYCLAHEPFLICECGPRIQKGCRSPTKLHLLSKTSYDFYQNGGNTNNKIKADI
jgi:hypothetical protein